MNSQPGGGRTTGLKIEESRRAGTLIQLQDVAIHVSGAAQNVALVRGDSLEIFGFRDHGCGAGHDRHL